jgi:uncharacterized membrane protein YphA (DoxX/SURF4 family)
MGRKLETMMLLLLRIALGALFIYAGVLKVVHPLDFQQAIENYRLLPRFATLPLAFYLPWLEIICGLALVFGRSLRAAAGIVAALCIVFLVALIQAWLRGLDIQCGCFGSAPETGGLLWPVLRDLLLLAVAGAIWLRAKK